MSHFLLAVWTLWQREIVRFYRQPSRVIGALALRPQQLPALVRLARDCRRASRVLVAFLDAYAGCLAERYKGTKTELLATI